MKGTEKQIKWAEDIKKENTKKIANFYKYVETSKDLADEAREVIIEKFEEVSQNAKFWIDNRESFKGHSDDWLEEEFRACKSKTFLETVIAPLF